MAIIREDNGDARANVGTQYGLSEGDVFEGRLDPASDQDWLRVELTAGTIYDFILNGVEAGHLQILDAQGNRVAEGENFFSYTKLRIFSPDTSGAYYIRIGSGNNDLTADYELLFEENPITTVSHDEIAGYMVSRHPLTRAFDVAPGGVLTANITALNEAGQQLARAALEAWTSVTGIKFELVASDDAHITFDDETDPDHLGAYAYRSTHEGFIVSAHVNVPDFWLGLYGTGIDSYSFSTYLHEIGHALGLDHPGPYDAQFPASIDKIFLNDTYQTTVMSYFRQDHDQFVDASFARPVTPMVADIIAIQSLYGVPVDINPGDTVYGYGSNVEGYPGELFEHWSGEGDSSFENPVTLTLYDSGGIDTLDLRTDTIDQRVDLRPEGFSNVYGLTGNLVIARDTLIENYIAGSGDDVVTGNDVANYLQGRDGDDDLRGNGGSDILEGGAGSDRLDGGPGADWASYRDSGTGVTVNLAEGTLAGAHAEGDVLVNIENIIGSAHADVLTGDDGANSLEGGPGADSLAGGAGEDTGSYARSSAGVTVRLHSGEARGGDAEGDTFAAMVTVGYTGSNGEAQQETVPDIEHLLGSAHADTLAGDSRANNLAGGPGDDLLYGGPGGGDDVLSGGPGADSLFGGTGDDVMEGGQARIHSGAGPAPILPCMHSRRRGWKSVCMTVRSGVAMPGTMCWTALKTWAGLLMRISWREIRAPTACTAGAALMSFGGAAVTTCWRAAVVTTCWRGASGRTAWMEAQGRTGYTMRGRTGRCRCDSMTGWPREAMLKATPSAALRTCEALPMRMPWRATAGRTGWKGAAATTGCWAAAGMTSWRAAPGRTAWTEVPGRTGCPMRDRMGRCRCGCMTGIPGEVMPKATLSAALRTCGAPPTRMPWRVPAGRTGWRAAPGTTGCGAAAEMTSWTVVPAPINWTAAREVTRWCIGIQTLK